MVIETIWTNNKTRHGELVSVQLLLDLHDNRGGSTAARKPEKTDDRHLENWKIWKLENEEVEDGHREDIENEHHGNVLKIAGEERKENRDEFEEVMHEVLLRKDLLQQVEKQYARVNSVRGAPRTNW